MYKLVNGIELRTGDVVEVSFNGCTPIRMMYMDRTAGDEWLSALVECTGHDTSWSAAQSLCGSSADIKKVYRPVHPWSFPVVDGDFDESLYKVIYDNTPKELTVDEISRLLGYKVKVIGTDK